MFPLFPFQNHGWCAQADSCPMSHDVDKILDNEHLPHTKRRHRRKRKPGKASNVENMESVPENDIERSTNVGDVSMESIGPGEDSLSSDMVTADSGGPNPASEQSTDVHSSRTEGHRAGFDAFMTGFVFAHFISKHGDFKYLPSGGTSMTDLGMQDFQNRVALSGKDIPLQITKSNFAKTSKDHNEKISSIKT